MRSTPPNIDFKDPGERVETSPVGEVKSESDLETWLSFKEGDESAFIFIYRKYANLLFNFGTKFSADRELVKDCLQDFFLYLRNNRGKLGNTDSIKLYLLKSFKRRVVEYVIKSDNEKKRNKNAIDFLLEIEISDELKFINAQLQEEQVRKLNCALENLDKKEREAVYYFYYQGLGYKEIAELMDFTHISSARRLIYRALSHLRNFFVLVILFFA